MLQSSHIICEAREEKRDSNLHCGGVEGLCVGEFLISERTDAIFLRGEPQTMLCAVNLWSKKKGARARVTRSHTTT